MSSLPPPLPFPPSSSPSLPRAVIPIDEQRDARNADAVTRSPGYRRSAIISWALILLFVGLEVVPPLLRPADHGRKAPSTMPASGGDADLDPSILTDRTEFRSAARAALGTFAMSHWLDESDTSPRPGTGSETSLKAVNEIAATPYERLHAAILAGEIVGAADAIQRLDGLAPRDDDDAGFAQDIESLRMIYGGNVASTDGAERPVVETIPSQATMAPAVIDPATTDPATTDSATAGPATMPSAASTRPATYAKPSDALSEAQRAQLIARHGRYGRLALAFATPTSSPAHAEVLAPARRAMLVSIVLLIVVVGGAVIGLVLIVLAIILLAQGILKLHYRPARPAVPRAVFAEAFALYMLLFIGFLVFIGPLVRGWGLGANMLATIVLPIVLSWPVWRGATWAETRMGFGWHLGPTGNAFGTSRLRFFREMGWGVVGYITGLPLVGCAMVVSTKLSKFAGVSPTHPILREFGAGNWRMAQVYLLACVWAPIMEETMFRGALFNHMRRRSRWLISAMTTSVIFAAIHPQGWTLIPVLGSIAIVLAAIREWRGGLVASMTAHGLSNFIVTTLGASMLG